VIVAVEAEARAILADGRFRWRTTGAAAGGRSFASEAFPIVLELCGVGKAFASWSLARIADDCDLVVSLGTSGGLSSESVGSLHLVREFVEHDMSVTGLGIEAGVTPFEGMDSPVISPLSEEGAAFALAALEASGLEADWARAASGDRFIGDAAEAAELKRRTGASLCDMECAALAKLCAFRGASGLQDARALDFFALRAVSDNADHAAQHSWARQAELSAKDFDTYLYALASLL
jgi:nucleoside phosphorylase